MPDPVLPIQVNVTRRLAQRLPPTWVENLRQAAQELLDAYGLPAQAQVALTTRPAPRPLWLTLDGVACPYPTEAVDAAWAWVRRDLAAWDSLARLEEEGGEDSAAILHFACLEILKNQPGRWLTPAVAAHYYTQLADHLGGAPLPDADAWQQTLTWLLNWHIPIGAQTAVAELLRENGRQIQPLDQREALYRRLRPPDLRVAVNLATLRHLSFDATLDAAPFGLLRDGLFYELGLRLPDIHWEIAPELPDGAFRFGLNALVTLPQPGLSPDLLFTNATPEQLVGLEARPARHPVNGRRAALIPAVQSGQLAADGYSLWGPLGYLILALSRQTRRCAGALFDQAAYELAAQQLKPVFPALLEALALRWSPPAITQVARLLLAEGISIRNWRHIWQSLVDFDVILADPADLIILDERLPVAAEAAWRQAATPVNLAAYVRSTLKTYLTHKLTGGAYSLAVHLLDPDIEAQLAPAAGQNWDSHLAQAEATLGEDLRQAVRQTLATATPPWPAILTSIDVRPTVQALLAPEWPDLPVISYSDLDPSVNLYPGERIYLDA